jgi:DNA polymerase III subunit alpha
MTRIVEVYSDDEPFFVVPEGKAYPTSCLVEDDGGFRFLLSNTASLSVPACFQAAAGGAIGVLIILEGQWLWMDGTNFPDPSRGMPSSGVLMAERLSLEVEQARFSVMAFASRGIVASIPSESPFVHLHAHSEFSALDGLSTVDEMVAAAVADGNPAIAITDHGVCSGHPQMQKAAMDAGVKPIFGLEAYFVGDRHARGPGKLILPPEPKSQDFSHMPTRREQMEALKQAREQWAADKERGTFEHKARQKAALDYGHLILWAETDQGLRNLWAISTASYLTGFYGKPRVDWDLLQSHAEGVLCSTACLRGPLARPIVNDDEEMARHNLARLASIFSDRLYVEIHTNGLADQRKANIEAQRLAHEFGLPMIAAVDSHYPCADDDHAHKVWLSAQTNKALTDDSGLFEGDEHYHIFTTDEVRKSLDYLPGVDEMIANTVAVADRCTAALKPRLVMPIYSRQVVGTEDERRQADERRLSVLCLGTKEDNWVNFRKMCGRPGLKHSQEVYLDRFDREMDLLRSKGFCGYFLMVADQVRYAKSQGILVGPGRGSGGGSLIAYLCGITAIDPVEAGLLFERFLTEGRDEPPDFDVDYPSTKRDVIQDYCSDTWGADHTMRVGTHMRLKSKGVINDLSRVFPDTMDYADVRAFAKFVDEAEANTAGKGLPWDELWLEHGEELDPFRKKYPEIFALADRFRGRLKSYGKHAAGMVISPDEVLTDNLPMRTAENSNHPISQFDMDALTLLGYIKFDILTLRNLDTIQMCIDIIRENRGVEINVYDWTEGVKGVPGLPDEPGEYADPMVWKEISDGHTLGIFQIETPGGTRMVKRFRPGSIAELADVITLVRPGPVRSGLTEAYLRRREGLEPVSVPDERLADILAPTYGCIIYQEQVMQTCQILAGYSLNDADKVRKILGKKQTELVEKAGKEFVDRCVTFGGCDRGMAEELWEALAEFAKYSFNKSHAWAYAVIGYWTAWLKVVYPIEFSAAALSTIDKDRIPQFVNDARRLGYAVKPPDINESKIGFTATGMACRFGFDRINNIGEAQAQAIIQSQPYVSFDDFMERKGSAANRGVVKRLATVGAFDSLVPNRKALVAQLEWEDSPESSVCRWHSAVSNEHGLPCRFDWSSEPVKVGKTGRPLKNQPQPPKNCTKGCRNYSAPETPDWSLVLPYTDREVREIEMEAFGTFLSSTPFDQLRGLVTEDYPNGFLQECYTGLAINDMVDGGGRDLTVAAIIMSKRKVKTKRGEDMGFLTLYAQDAEIDCAVFGSDLDRLWEPVVKGNMVGAILRKTPKGTNIKNMHIFHEIG